MSLRDLVQERLSALKISQAALADRAGLPRSYVTDIIRKRKARIQPRFVETFARALEVSPEDLYSRMTATPPSLEQNQTFLSGDAYVVDAALTSAWFEAKNFPAVTGSGRSVPLFSSNDELRMATLDSGKTPRYRWPITLPWTRGAYALSKERGSVETSRTEVLLLAPDLPVRSGDRCVVFDSCAGTSGGGYEEVFVKNDGDVLIFEHDRRLRTRNILKMHRLLAILAAS
jgi:transcriptional regulator with XRE-family HTH domain